MGKANLAGPRAPVTASPPSTGQKTPLLILDINRADFEVPASGSRRRRSKARSKSEERPMFRLHVLFGQMDEVCDIQKKKDWVFDSELRVSSRSKYLDMVRMFKESVQGLENRPEFFTYYSTAFIFFLLRAAPFVKFSFCINLQATGSTFSKSFAERISSSSSKTRSPGSAAAAAFRSTSANPPTGRRPSIAR